MQNGALKGLPTALVLTSALLQNSVAEVRRFFRPHAPNVLAPETTWTKRELGLPPLKAPVNGLRVREASASVGSSQFRLCSGKATSFGGRCLPLYRPKRELKDAQDGGRFNVVFFFRSTLIYRKVKARPRSRLIQRRALTPAMILFVALPEPKAKPDPG